MEKILEISQLTLPVRSFDIKVPTLIFNPEQIFALIVLVFISPFMLIITIIIKISSKGSVFFLQEREGKDGKFFKIYKYRTMFEGEPANLSSSHQNRECEKRRITFIGKFLRKSKIDELPQLINILRGEMAFVGPRPRIRQESSCLNYIPRVKGVLPGLTGWEQTSPKRDIKGYHTSHYDSWYATRKCISLDLYIILWRTPVYILF